MTPAIKAVAGVVSLCAIVPTSYAVYHALSSNNTPSRKRLENSGYSLEPPKLSPSNKLNNRYGCADRLFKEMKVSGMKPDPSDETVYGCAIMFLETTQDNKLSDFDSHIAIRKGNKGWIINIDIGSMGGINHTYVELNYSNNEWTQESWTWPTRSPESSSDDSNEKIIIKVAEENWTADINERSSPGQTDTKIAKEFSKAWISDNNGPKEWILKGMMIAKESEEQSQIFCAKGVNEINDCFSGVTISNITKAQGKGLDSFQGANLLSGSSNTTSKDLTDKLKTTYQTLSSSKGSWKELSEICSYGKNGDIDADKQKKLEMFCAVLPSEGAGFGVPPNISPVPSTPLPAMGEDVEVAINLPS